MPAGLPNFRNLVLDVYKRLDATVHAVLETVPEGACNRWPVSTEGLSNEQCAEVKRFVRGEYDVVLGLLERRMDGPAAPTNKVRHAIAEILRAYGDTPALIHKALVRLANRGAATTIVTTNFDTLLEAAARTQRKALRSYSLGGIPRPSRSEDFAGVLHIHGLLGNRKYASELIITDQDLGEYYLRRRIIPDFIYDAARLFNLVLVGYSANDAPMRYLLNAVAADVSRFTDLKERFVFIGTSIPPDAADMEDWKGRGITPIPYSDADRHIALAKIMQRWAELSAINGNRSRIDAELKRIASSRYAVATEDNRDLFEHLIRRSSGPERVRISTLLSEIRADIGWLDAIVAVGREMGREKV